MKYINLKLNGKYVIKNISSNTWAHVPFEIDEIEVIDEIGEK